MPLETDNLMPLDRLDPDTIHSLRGVFFDIDDTFSCHGRIPACAFEALWALHDAGLLTIPVTGRPAGWCDHIARMWPVDAVIGENGALYFWMDPVAGKLRKVFADPAQLRREKKKRLQDLARHILSSVAGTALASDQAYREADLAIDFCEDVPPLNHADIVRICRLFEDAGATCKVSSIHVNGWFGDYDKLKMVGMFARDRLNLSLEQAKKHFVYCGDSPNDETMFRFFPLSVGVHNVLRFKDRMTHLPAFVTPAEGGRGFAQLAERILRYRRKG